MSHLCSLVPHLPQSDRTHRHYYCAHDTDRSPAYQGVGNHGSVPAQASRSCHTDSDNVGQVNVNDVEFMTAHKFFPKIAEICCYAALTTVANASTRPRTVWHLEPAYPQVLEATKTNGCILQGHDHVPQESGM